MRQSLVVGLSLLAAVAVRDAAAQSAAPAVELGLDVSATLYPDRGGVRRGPRLIVNFNGADSVEMTASLEKLSPWENVAERETDLYLAAYRRLVYTAGPIRVLANLGGGLERTVIVVPAITFGNPPVTFPSSRGVETLPAFTTGAGIDFRLGRRAAIVIESSFVLTNRLDGRLSGGLVVPVGSYPSRPARLASSVPWATLDAGERAWVTTADNREVEGEVVGGSAGSLTLRTRVGPVSFSAADVRAIDTTDPIRNGTVLGAKIGGLGALVPSVLISYLVCALELECGVDDVLWFNGVMVGMGAGIGAAAGALADSLRQDRVSLYRRGGPTGVTLAPIIDGQRLGGRAVIRW
jgi:hypothetical protein